MNRFLALVGAVILAFISVSSACTAAPAQWIHFTLEPERGRDGIQASFRSEGRAGHQNNWSAEFRPAEFAGLDTAGFRGAGTRPLRFSLTREAGRLDCSGRGGQSHAEGNCGFTPDPSFLALLDSRGIARPTDEQAFGLMAVNARRELIDAISAAHYPAPKISDLITLAALDVSGAYIREMAGAGYRPPNLQGLVQFKAMGITPQWIAGFVRIGYGDVPADQLVQLKALNITPQFIAGFDQVGYRHLPVDKLVQLKALDITPEFARRVAGPGQAMPDIGKLVELRSFSERH